MNRQTKQRMAEALVRAGFTKVEIAEALHISRNFKCIDECSNQCMKECINECIENDTKQSDNVIVNDDVQCINECSNQCIDECSVECIDSLIERLTDESYNLLCNAKRFDWTMEEWVNQCDAIDDFTDSELEMIWNLYVTL